MGTEIIGPVRSSGCQNVRPFGTRLSKSTKSTCLFQVFLRSVSGLSQVSVSSLTYFEVQTEPKILHLVRFWPKMTRWQLFKEGSSQGFVANFAAIFLSNVQYTPVLKPKSGCMNCARVLSMNSFCS